MHRALQALFAWVWDLQEGIARIKWAIDPTSPNDIFIGDRKLLRDWL